MRTEPSFPHLEILGQFRQFGPYGPSYEVMDVAGMVTQKGWMMTIRVVETEEKLAYPYRKLVDDPAAN